MARVERAWELYDPQRNLDYGAFTWGRPRSLAIVGLVAYVLLVPAAAAGAFLLRRERRSLLPLLAVVVQASSSRRSVSANRVTAPPLNRRSSFSLPLHSSDWPQPTLHNPRDHMTDLADLRRATTTIVLGAEGEPEVVHAGQVLVAADSACVLRGEDFATVDEDELQATTGAVIT